MAEQLALFGAPRPLTVRRVCAYVQRRHRTRPTFSGQLAFIWPKRTPTANRSIIAPGRWFPIAPLLDWFIDDMPVFDREHARREFARTIGMTQRNLRRRLEVGVIDGDTADRWAIACDKDPSVIWPEWYDDLLDLDHDTLCDTCGAELVDLFCCLDVPQSATI